MLQADWQDAANANCESLVTRSIYFDLLHEDPDADDYSYFL
jgi:hypothetical protein